MKNREIPITSTYDVATFDILIDEQLVDPGYQVLSISVIKEANRLPSAKLVIKDGESSNETFRLSEQEEFLPGKSIRIKAGRDGKNSLLFKGIIIRHSIKISESGESELQLDCRDEAVKMSLGRHSRYFENLKDSEIIEQLIGSYPGLTREVGSTSLTHSEMVQYHCTDWDFLLMRAEANGRLVFVDDGKISVSTPVTTGDAAVAVLYGSTLIDFEAEMDGRQQWKSAEAKSWDYGSQELFDHTSDKVPVSEPGNVKGATLADNMGAVNLELRHTGQAIAEELQQWASSSMQLSRLSKIRGRAKFEGFPGIKPGQLIELQGVGARFNGKAYVSAVRQDIYNGAWYTQVQFGLNPNSFAKEHPDINALPASGLLPAIHGLQIGKVVQLENDPDGENRILVRLPIIDIQARGVWARVATLDAGSERGSFFLPEIDDEVIVGFLNDDPRDAVVLGMVHSSAHPAPISAKDVNHEKGFVTRSGMRVHFNDDTKTITIDTPAGNRVVLDDNKKAITLEDQNGNSTKMDNSGIVMRSSSDLKIEASGSIDLKAGTKLTLAAAQMAISAQASMELKGATAKLASDGVTEIKGSLVSIN